MAKLTRSRSDDSGQILIQTALSMVVILAVASLSIDASFMYDKRNKLFAAADAAAKSGAIEVWRNASVTNGELQAFGNQQVAAHGFDPTTTTSVIINRPPATGPFSLNPSYVEAIVSEPTGTIFGGILGMLSMTPGARAVAGTSAGPNCIVTLNPAVPPAGGEEAMEIGNSVLNMPTCSVASAGDLVTDNPNADINSRDTSLSGGCSGGGCGNMSNMTTGAPAPTDPLATLPQPTLPGSCTTTLTFATGSVGTIPSGVCYASIHINQNSTITLAPGIIHLAGRLQIDQNVSVNGTGVMIHLAGTAARADCDVTPGPAGCISVHNRATWNVSAATSGTYEGILFFQDRTNQLDAEFDGNNPIYNLSGAMYFPAAHVSFRNGLNASNDCMLLVAASFYVDNGNGNFSNQCSSYGGSPLMTVSLAE